MDTIELACAKFSYLGERRVYGKREVGGRGGSVQDGRCTYCMMSRIMTVSFGPLAACEYQGRARGLVRRGCDGVLARLVRFFGLMA
jgi:hypothetical protein